MTIETNGQELAQGIDKLLDELTVKPTRFAANAGKLHAQFNHRKRLIAITAELKGNFVMEFEVDINEVAKDPESAFQAVRDHVGECGLAALERRHNERSTLASVMQEITQ